MKENLIVCDLCKKKFNEVEGSYHWIGKELRKYCKKCSPKIENQSKLPEVMIIPITPKNFKKVMEDKIYFHPINYARRGGGNIAFYVSRPISAITHLAKVDLILKDKGYKMYFLGHIQKLRRKILLGDSSGIQGTINVSLKKLNNSRFVKDLYSK